MTKSHKTTFVADILHNPIALTPLEKSIIGTAVFNRLHSVKQNSTAYLTFPSLNHPRFSHSLGAAAIGGKLFEFGLKNAHSDTVNIFLDDIHGLLEKLSRNLTPVSFTVLADSPETNLDSLLSKPLPWIASHDQANLVLSSPQRELAFLITRQALRIAALVHDLGHPPFSHVTEYALKEVYSVLAEKDELNEAEHEFVECLRHREEGLPEHTAPHELLTFNLFSFLITQIIRELDNQENIDYFLAAWFSLHLAKAILSEGGSESFSCGECYLLKALHNIISSDLDADRLDYIQRDSLLSGIRDDHLGLNRLIYLYQLDYVDSALAGEKITPPTKIPLFVPSIRALRNVEDFFHARYSLYRSVIYHHHVVKTDAFLQDSVKQMIFRRLEGGKRLETKVKNNAVLDIAWLWVIFGSWKDKGAAFLERVYLRWDDHWLISLLRSEYIDMVSAKNSGTNLNLVRLEELIAGKRHYISLIKRLGDFLSIDVAFVKCLRQHPQFMNDVVNSNLLSRQVPNLNSSISSWVQTLQGIIKNSGDEQYNVSGATRSALYLLQAAETEDLFSIIATRLREKAHLEDCMIVDKQIKPGVARNFLIHCDHGAAKYETVSSQPHELRRRSETWPALFAFVLPRKNSSVNASELRGALGEIIASLFMEKFSTKQQALLH